VYFIGTWTTSNKSGLKSWTSLDYINSITGKTDLTIELTKNTAMGHVIMEGEPMILSHKYRPKFMAEKYGINQMTFSIFDYKSREEYDKRIIGRSGKVAGDGGWSRNESYSKQPEKIELEFKELSESADYKYSIQKYNYDADFTVFGEMFLNFIGENSLVDEFLLWSETNNTLRSVEVTNNIEDEWG
jgi:hypothetical protein